MAADTDMVLLQLRIPGHPPALATVTGIAMALDPAIATSACSDSDKAPRTEYGYGCGYGFGGRCCGFG